MEVNKRDLKLAIMTGLNPMQQLFDQKQNNLPYFGNCMTSGADFGNTHHKSFSPSHIPGRWLAALLSAESVIGTVISEEAINKLRYWAFKSIENTMIGFPACMNETGSSLAPVTDLHNLREVMHALYALTAFRNDHKAMVLASGLIETIDRYYDYNNCCFLEKEFERNTGGKAICCAATKNEKFPFPPTFGRYIGPLVKLYKASGYTGALRQAIMLKDVAFRYILNENGDYDVDLFGSHTHSTTSMVSSLAQLGEVISDRNILDRVDRFMKNGLNTIALDFGWCIENYHRDDMVGEINNTADIMESYLILAKAGYAGYYSKAERILRTHLLPSQLLDTSFIPDTNIGNSPRYFAEQSKGAFGFPCPYGHEDHPGARISFNWDIVGGGVLGLCKAWESIVTVNEGLVSINLLFDITTDMLNFSSPYNENMKASLILYKKAPVRIRIPDGSIIFAIEGCKHFINDEWVYLSDPPTGVKIIIVFQFLEQIRTYTFRNKQIVFRTNGEEVTGASSHGKRLCFFEEIECEQLLG